MTGQVAVTELDTYLVWTGMDSVFFYDLVAIVKYLFCFVAVEMKMFYLK